MTVKYKNIGRAIAHFRKQAMDTHFEKTGQNAPYRAEDFCTHFGKYATWMYNIEENRSPVSHELLTQFVEYLKQQLPELTIQMILDKANS